MSAVHLADTEACYWSPDSSGRGLAGTDSPNQENLEWLEQKIYRFILLSYCK